MTDMNTIVGVLLLGGDDYVECTINPEHKSKPNNKSLMGCLSLPLLDSQRISAAKNPKPDND